MAWRLACSGSSFKIINDKSLASASQIAAGIINPITGKWMTKSWNIDNLLPEALETYLSIEKTLNIKILNEIPIRRYFLNINDLDRAKKRIKNPRYSTYINKINSYNEGPSVLKDSYGSIEISKGCWINLPLLLSHLEIFFLSKNLYVESYFDPNRLTKNGSSNRWEYDNLSSKNVIFCQGIHSLRNKYFSSLPIIPIKGEILSLKLNNVNIPNGIYYKKKWLIAENDSECYCGCLPNMNKEKFQTSTTLIH